ncbi:MAG: PAS domain-containing protein, partial [Sediminibacterium sp.]|nr:PAS domain-containing protein [Sediminibacterium sp.]
MHTLGVDIVSSLLDEMPLALFRFETEGGGRMHYLSSGIEQITGYQPIHFLFQPLSIFREGILESDRLQLGKLIHQAQKDNGSYEMTYRFRHQHGSIRYLYEKGTCSKDEYGQTWIEGFVADMSQKRRED